MGTRHVNSARSPGVSVDRGRRGFGTVDYGTLEEPPVTVRRQPERNSLSYWLFRKGGMVVVVMGGLIALGVFGAIFGQR